VEIGARSDAAWRRLITEFVAFYADNLFNPHWGELVQVRPGRHLQIGMNFQGLDRQRVDDLWRSFLNSAGSDEDVSVGTLTVGAVSGRERWDGGALARLAPGSVMQDDRPGAPPNNVYWTANRAEAGHVIQAFESLWLPADLLEPERRSDLVDALVAASGHWTIELHFQKGLAGAPDDIRAAALDTPMNPDVASAFALAIIGSEAPPGFQGLSGHEPEIEPARRNAARVAAAVGELRKAAPSTGAYLAESGYRQPDWQDAYWGENYVRLQSVKARYDRNGLFFARHGVGSERWSEDGFTRLS
jgi:hypothetical protein